MSIFQLLKKVNHLNVSIFQLLRKVNHLKAVVKEKRTVQKLNSLLRKIKKWKAFLLWVSWRIESINAVQDPNWASFLVAYTVPLCCFCTKSLTDYIFFQIDWKFSKKCFTECFEVNIKILETWLSRCKRSTGE